MKPRMNTNQHGWAPQRREGAESGRSCHREKHNPGYALCVDLFHRCAGARYAIAVRNGVANFIVADESILLEPALFDEEWDWLRASRKFGSPLLNLAFRSHPDLSSIVEDVWVVILAHTQGDDLVVLDQHVVQNPYVRHEKVLNGLVVVILINFGFVRHKGRLS